MLQEKSAKKPLNKRRRVENGLSHFAERVLHAGLEMLQGECKRNAVTIQAGAGFCLSHFKADFAIFLWFCMQEQNGSGKRKGKCRIFGSDSTCKALFVWRRQATYEGEAFAFEGRLRNLSNLFFKKKRKKKQNLRGA